MKKIKLTIEGMHCGNCAGNVEKALSKIPGVKEVSASIMTKKAIIEAEDDVSIDALKEAISKLSYRVVEVN